MTTDHIRYETPGATRYTDILRGVVDDEALKALRERNAARLAEAQAALGPTWLLANKQPLTKLAELVRLSRSRA